MLKIVDVRTGGTRSGLACVSDRVECRSGTLQPIGAKSRINSLHPWKLRRAMKVRAERPSALRISKEGRHRIPRSRESNISRTKCTIRDRRRWISRMTRRLIRMIHSSGIFRSCFGLQKRAPRKVLKQDGCRTKKWRQAGWVSSTT